MNSQSTFWDDAMQPSPAPTYNEAGAALDSALTGLARKNREWCQAATRIVCDFSATVPDFISDDVWPLLAAIGKPSDPRALGSAMTAAKSAGYIEKTGAYRLSKRRHLSPQPVWRRKSV